MTALFSNSNAIAMEDCNFDPSGRLDFVTLKRIITTESCQIKSIEQLLSKLPDPLVTNPNLFYQSHSLQGPHLIDYQNPRAILVSKEDGKQMMMTFNGNVSQPGFQNLEIVEIDKTVPRPSTAIFNYYDIHFAKNGIQISNPNPKQCTACHGNPARPIFEGYPKWDGSYGSFHLHSNPEETSQFQQFIEAAPSHPRYQYLKFSSSDNTKTQIGADLLIGMTNVRTNVDLQEGSALLVARMAQTTPDYDLFKFAIAGAFTGCDVPSFFPTLVREDMEKSLNQRLHLDRQITTQKINNILDAFRKDGTDQFGEIASMGDDGLGKHGYRALPDLATFVQTQKNYWQGSKIAFQLWIDTLGKQGLQRSSTVPPRLRYVLESRGIDLSSWFLDLRQPTYRDMSGGGAETSMNAFFKDDPTLPGSNVYLPSFQDPIICQQLKDRSLKALSDANYSVPKNSSSTMNYQASLVRGAYPATFVSTCAQCHAYETVGPAIPFNDADKFRDWFSDPSNQAKINYRLYAPEGERMPLTRDLSGDELKDIQSYLRLLKNSRTNNR